MLKFLFIFILQTLNLHNNNSGNEIFEKKIHVFTSATWCRLPALLLLSAKAAVNTQDKDLAADPRFSSATFKKASKHCTALHYASHAGNPGIAQVLPDVSARVF